MRKLLFSIPLSLAAICGFNSCMDDKSNGLELDEAWRDANLEYYQQMIDKVGDDGEKYFEAYAPEWGPGYQILVHWHNDRTLTAKNLVPLDNSTVDIKYELRLYDGTVLDSSYDKTTPADSIYRSKPMNNIPGMWALLTTMHVGDSVTCVIPYFSGYGIYNSGNVKGYSTLTFDVKLKSIVAWEKPV